MLQPRTPTELVDAAVQLTRRHFRTLVVIATVIAIPSVVLGIVARGVMPTNPQGMTDVAQMASASMLLFGLSLLSVAIMSVGMGAMVSSAAAAYEGGQPLEPMTALRQALRRAPAIVAGNVLAAVAVGLLVVVLVFGAALALGLVIAAVQVGGGGSMGVVSQAVGAIAGIGVGLGAVAIAFLFGVRYANITAAVVLEQLGPWAALRRSRELVRGLLWHTTGVVGIGLVFYVVTYFTALALAGLVLRDMELASTASGAVVVLVYPFVGCLMTVLYYDLRIRREGYDVVLMERALGGAAGAAADVGVTGSTVGPAAEGTSAAALPRS